MPSIRLPARAAALTVVLVVLAAACGDDDSGGLRAGFNEPADGAAVAGGVDVVMTAEGITIEAAGETRDGAGHFHVVADDGCVEPGTAVARDADHIHFGGGQSEGTIYLSPGTHELCLQVGDGAHVALDATDTITVQVGIADRDGWCAAAGEVDELFNATDNSDDEFAVKQVAYEHIGRLLAQLEDGLDHVDAAGRQAVATSIGFAASLTDALVAAADEQDAERRVEPIFGGRRRGGDRGRCAMDPRELRDRHRCLTVR